ncbi:hypothetical protein Tco_0655767 [Tanacetum coccineum]|uniref:Uncharacterized protein n=1 Tax=Tanacetum coccineum TaxID=301880 RepID=A0ABQ4X7F9_9ASTR
MNQLSLLSWPTLQAPQDQTQRYTIKWSKDKTGLGYGDQLNENDSSGSELFNSVFDSRSSDGDDNQTNDRIDDLFKAQQIRLVLFYNHLIKDCDFHEKRMAKSVLKDMGKVTGHREVRPVWNNTQRINHQNKFVPSAVLTRFGRVPVSAAKQSSFREAASTGAVKQGKTAVCADKGNGHLLLGLSKVEFLEAQNTDLNNGNPQQALKNKGIFDSGCSRHMTGNKDFLTDYQDIDGGFVPLVVVLEEKNNVLSLKRISCLSPDFKLLDENQVLLRVPKQSNMYSFDLRNVVPSGDLTCLFANATIDKSKLMA